MSAVSILGADERQVGSQLATSAGNQDLRKRPEAVWGASEKQRCAFQAAELIEVPATVVAEELAWVIWPAGCETLITTLA